MWWIADKVAYRNVDTYTRAYQGSEMIWDKTAVDVNKIYYTTDNNQVLTPSGTFGANIISNTYSNGQGVITFDGAVTEIGDRAFYNKERLTSIQYPLSVTRIGDRAFDSAYSYDVDCISTPYYITENIQYIGDWAFANIHQPYRTVNIPKRVSYIGAAAFSGTNTLHFRVDSNNRWYKSGDSNHTYCECIFTVADGSNPVKLIAGCENTIFPSFPYDVIIIGTAAFFNNAPSGENLTIPSGVQTIENQAFMECHNIKKVTIPYTVTSIGAYAFCDCELLRTVIVDATTPPTLGQYAFASNYSGGRTIRVPAGSVDAYKTAPGWSTYASSIVAQ